MDFRAFFRSLTPAEREHFAASAGTTVGHLRNCAYGHRRMHPSLCLAIERLTAGQVTRRELRPKDAEAIWPDLAARLPAALPGQPSCVSPIERLPAAACSGSFSS